MANSVPPPPYRTPATDRNGMMSPIWVNWIRQLFERVGGNVAPTNLELSGSTSSAQSGISALQGQVSALQSAVSELQENGSGLNQGRAL